jgi:uncharacterized FlaG/YvyC family protein
MERDAITLVSRVSSISLPGQSTIPVYGDETHERLSGRVADSPDVENSQSREGIDQLGALLQDYLQTQGTRIAFRVDSDSGQLVTEVRDSTTGELLRQIPPEETMSAAAAVHEYLGLIVNARH